VRRRCSSFLGRQVRPLLHTYLLRGMPVSSSCPGQLKFCRWLFIFPSIQRCVSRDLFAAAERVSLFENSFYLSIAVPFRIYLMILRGWANPFNIMEARGWLLSLTTTPYDFENIERFRRISPPLLLRDFFSYDRCFDLPFSPHHQIKTRGQPLIFSHFLRRSHDVSVG